MRDDDDDDDVRRTAGRPESPAMIPTAPLRLRCLVLVDSTSCSSDDAEDP